MNFLHPRKKRLKIASYTSRLATKWQKQFSPSTDESVGPFSHFVAMMTMISTAKLLGRSRALQMWMPRLMNSSVLVPVASALATMLHSGPSRYRLWHLFCQSPEFGWSCFSEIWIIYFHWAVPLVLRCWSTSQFGLELITLAARQSTVLWFLGI